MGRKRDVNIYYNKIDLYIFWGAILTFTIHFNRSSIEHKGTISYCLIPKGNGGPIFWGEFYRFVEGMLISFAILTRQLTSSAKAKEVKRPPYERCFFCALFTKKLTFNFWSFYFLRGDNTGKATLKRYRIFGEVWNLYDG